MARPYPEHALEEAQAALQRAGTADQLRRAQCVWMRLSLGMNAFQIGTAVGWSVWSVRGVQSQYRRKGAKAFEGWGRRSIVGISQPGGSSDACFDARRRSGAWYPLGHPNPPNAVARPYKPDPPLPGVNPR